jgi:trehalose-phosphatase
MTALRDRIRTNDVHTWVRRFLAAAEAASEASRATAITPAEGVRHALEGWLGTRNTVALFLDYDGTLTPLVDRPEKAELSDTAREILEQAARNSNIDLVVVSGRSLEDLRQRVGVGGITLVGNHGYEIEGPGISYRHPGVDSHRASVERAAAKLAAIDVPGTQVEHKGSTVAFHVRRVEPARKAEATRRGLAVFRQEGLRVLLGNEVVEGRPPLEWHKGQAVLYVLRERHGSAWPTRVRAIYMGDDTTDEDAFRSLRGIGRSVQVGSPGEGRGVMADFLLPDPGAVLQVLRWLASGGFVVAG